jgi:hypothetical protein
MKLSDCKFALLLTCVLFISVADAGQSNADQPQIDQLGAEQKVMAFVTAFNEKDVDAMLSLATENVTWMSIDGETIAAEASGSENLKSAMEGYFASHSSSYSKIKQIQSSGPWVTTLEHAGKDIDGQFKGQCAYAMYQFNDGLIQSVWYFSAHPCDQE